MFGYYPQGLFGYSPGAVLSLQLDYSLRTNTQTIPHHSLLCKHPDRMHIYGPGAFLDFLLLQYNWWFHYSRIETDEGVLDGRPEAVRQAYYEVLWMYFDLDRAWPSHVDTYYFDLDCANRQEILSEDADRVSSLSLPRGGSRYSCVDAWREGQEKLLPSGLSVSLYENLECLRCHRHDDETAQFLAVGGLDEYVVWDGHHIQLRRPPIHKDGSESDSSSTGVGTAYLNNWMMRQWCVVYKCCQVRVDDGSLEDGRSPYLRRYLDTEYIMGFFSAAKHLHVDSDGVDLPVDDDGYTPIDEDYADAYWNRRQIEQHRDWLARRRLAGLSAGLESPPTVEYQYPVEVHRPPDEGRSCHPSSVR